LKSNQDVLEDLVQFLRPLDLLEIELKQLPWDNYSSLVVLKREHIISVLQRYLLNEITSQDIEDWANLIECREDLTYERPFEEEIKESIYKLANPILEGVLNFEMSRAIIHNLSSR
jgi:hypothetical protein